MSADAYQTPRYQLPPLERRGVLLGLRGLSVGTLACGALAGLGAAASIPGGAGLACALGVAALAAALACFPLNGQPPVAWAPVLVRSLVRPSRSLVPAGHLAGAARATPGGVIPAEGDAGPYPGRSGRGDRRATSALQPTGIRIVEVPRGPGEPPLGAVEDRMARTWAAVLPAYGEALGLLDPAQQAGRLAAWGSALAGLGRPGTCVRRIQWVERCTPASGEEVRARAAEVTGLGPAVTSYRHTLDQHLPLARHHTAYLVVAVRAPGGLRRTGLDPRLLGQVLRRELRLLLAQLHAGDLGTGPALGVAEVAEALRSGCDLTHPGAASGAILAGASSGAGRPWPMAQREEWGAVEVDGNWQATYWIEEWPAVPVGPDVLGPLLLSGGARAVSVTMAPVPPERAMRQAQSARAATMADEALRARAGFLATSARRKESDGVQRREAELADGHAEFRFSGYVTVAAENREGLAAECAAVEHAARQCHLSLRRLYGRQAEARMWTLPVARGVG